MNRYSNEDIAWLHLQDVQREAENRRLAAGGRRWATVAAIRRLLGRKSEVSGRAQSAEARRRPA